MKLHGARIQNVCFVYHKRVAVLFIFGICSTTGFNPILIMIFSGSETYLFAIRGTIDIAQQVCAINLNTLVLQLELPSTEPPAVCSLLAVLSETTPVLDGHSEIIGF